jgi:hypothetical protein
MSLATHLDAGFADASRLLPIGGEVTGEIATLDRTLVVVAARALAVDSAAREGMWRTWMVDALGDAAKEARAAAVAAFSSVPGDRPEMRTLIERRCAGLDAFLAKYPRNAF